MTLAKVQVIWQDRLGNDKFANSRCFDICETGVRLEMPEPIQAQSYVTLRAISLGLQCRGSVRHCSKHGARYIVGVEFAGGLRWKAPANLLANS